MICSSVHQCTTLIFPGPADKVIDLLPDRSQGRRCMAFLLGNRVCWVACQALPADSDGRAWIAQGSRPLNKLANAQADARRYCPVDLTIIRRGLREEQMPEISTGRQCRNGDAYRCTAGRSVVWHWPARQWTGPAPWVCWR